jgi:hypothetical protein
MRIYLSYFVNNAYSKHQPISLITITGRGKEKRLVEILEMRCENIMKLRDKGELG